VQLANTGTADVRLALSGSDTEDACRFRFPKDDMPLVRSATKTQVALVVQPLKRPWLGPERSYDFTVTARPHEAGGEPQTVAGQFTFRPLFPSWAPVRRVFVLASTLIALFVGFQILERQGVIRAFPDHFAVASVAMRGWTCGAPVVGGFCPAGLAEESRASHSCTFQRGFKVFAEANPTLIGDCQTDDLPERFGNTIQYSASGMLVWQKNSNTVYFFRGDSVWAFIQGETQRLYGSGRF
jgi:hypothetical protein